MPDPAQIGLFVAKVGTLLSFSLTCALASVACSSRVGYEPPFDPELCGGSCELGVGPIEVGFWDGERIQAFDVPQQLVYGPQGGQHFYADVRLSLPVKGRAQLLLTFRDPLTDARVGIGRAQLDVDRCGALAQRIAVLMENDEPRRGRLEVEVQLGSCTSQSAFEDVELVRPF